MILRSRHPLVKLSFSPPTEQPRKILFWLSPLTLWPLEPLEAMPWPWRKSRLTVSYLVKTFGLTCLAMGHILAHVQIVWHIASPLLNGHFGSTLMTFHQAALAMTSKWPHLLARLSVSQCLTKQPRNISFSLSPLTVWQLPPLVAMALPWRKFRSTVSHLMKTFGLTRLAKGNIRPLIRHAKLAWHIASLWMQIASLEPLWILLHNVPMHVSFSPKALWHQRQEAACALRQHTNAFMEKAVVLIITHHVNMSGDAIKIQMEETMQSFEGIHSIMR